MAKMFLLVGDRAAPATAAAENHSSRGPGAAAVSSQAAASADYGCRGLPPSRWEFQRRRHGESHCGGPDPGRPLRTRRGLIALRPRGIAHHGNNVGLRRRADIVLRPLAHLVAFIEQLDLLHLLEGLAQGRFGIFELDLQILRRALEVVAPLDRRLGIGRIGEMARIMNAGAILLDLDVALEIAADALEFADHALDLGDPATPLVDLKFLQANECLA